MLSIHTAKVEASFREETRVVDDLVDALGSRYEMLIPTSTEISRRLTFFVEGTSRGVPARDAFEYNDTARKRVEPAVRQAFNVRRPNVLIALQAGARAFRDLMVDRLNAGGGDVSFDQLAPSTARQKARKGQSARPGVASGDTRSALKSALVVVRKRK